MPDVALREPLNAFCEDLRRNFAGAAAVPAQAEDQLKPPIVHLLQTAGGLLGVGDVLARTEAAAGELAVRPDVGVSVSGLITGHIELKAPGKGARPRSFTDPHDREQFKRLSDHPNLVYTDGIEWALYRHGQLVGSVVRASGDVLADGAGAYTDSECLGVEAVLRDFLGWEPIVPTSPKALAEALAPLAHLLRESVVEALARPESALAHLAAEWRDYFFPEADDAQFADAYAQTLTYALLLARVEGETDLHARAAERLERRHGLLAQALRILAQPEARDEVDVPVSLLERSIAAVDPAELARRARNHDLWLYFYEDFLAAYDQRMRRQRGVYFTPPPVVHAQVALVSELLGERFGASLGFADEGVTVLDPAVGTGTYLLAAMEQGAEAVREGYGAGAVPGRASGMADRFYGFELLVGAYAVSHLRFSQEVVRLEGELPDEGPHIYLTDTLESPYLAPQGAAHAPLFVKKLAEENERAREVKRDTPILVCLGNPPYFRQVIGPDEEGVERQGGWVREDDDGQVGILRDFLRDAPPVHAKNLYNLYVYFWRWALWKVFESEPRRGIVSFITASSYLRGPGFAGMRRYMRETFDELWILDLGGEGRGARRSDNVFAIQTPVAIAIGVRDAEARPGEPALVRYARIDGTQEGKFQTLESITSFRDIAWAECFDGWTEPFLPTSTGDFFAWPLLTDVFPWQHSGVQFKRTWPIAPDRETLGRRWRALVSAPPERRPTLFRETRDRKVARAYPPLMGDGDRLPLLSQAEEDAPVPPSVSYAYRTFDRHYCMADNRLGDFLRPVLWRTASARQLFMTSFLSGLLGSGPAAIATHLVPDMDHFRGSFGAKHVVPLWRDAACALPNITAGLIGLIGDAYDRTVTPEELFAYCYAMLSAPGYVEAFAEELEVPGPRVPITKDAGLFARAVTLGCELVWLHTHAERFVPEGTRVGQVPQGAARAVGPVGGTAESYPTGFVYDEGTQELHVGDGVFAPVSPAVFGFSVSGLHVVGSWLGYRMKDGAGRRSSPLDAIHTEVWPAAFTEELLRLLWILERTVTLAPELDATLAAVTDGPVFRVDELPAPSDEERLPPAG